MISLLQKKSLKFFHPILRRLGNYYLSKPRNYTYQDIIVKVLPGVFHPGLFFSTKVFLEYLESVELKGKRVLELGAGSGLISVYCSKQGSQVTASDINNAALEGITFNAHKNKETISIVHSDLFDQIDPDDFDIILINPPYYPKKPKDIGEKAWFCGEKFEYFQKLFKQLRVSGNQSVGVLMILSEDCELKKIMSIAKSNALNYEQVFTKIVNGEENYIFRITQIID